MKKSLISSHFAHHRPRDKLVTYYLTAYDLDVQRQNMAQEKSLVGRVTYANGDAQDFIWILIAAGASMFLAIGGLSMMSHHYIILILRPAPGAIALREPFCILGRFCHAAVALRFRGLLHHKISKKRRTENVVSQ